MASTEIMTAVLGLFAAGIIKGLTGIGYATCAMPFLVMGIGLETAMAVVLAPAIASNLAILFQQKHDVHRTANRFMFLYLSLLPGIAVGLHLMTVIDASHATELLAAVTIGYVALALSRPSLTLPTWLERPLAGPAGFLNGVLTGLTGSQIFPLVPYMMSLRLDPTEQVQAVNLAVLITSFALAAGLLYSGIMTGTLLVISAAGVLPALAGVSAGVMLRAALPIQRFRLVALTVLLGIAVSMLVRVHLDTLGSFARAGADTEMVRTLLDWAGLSAHAASH